MSVKFETTLGASPFYTPSDTYFNLQWHLRNTGQNGGTAGVDIDVTRVWDQYRGQGVRVAIIDDGFDLNHVDLATNFNTTNDYDFRYNDANPQFESGDEHGTAVAGVIGADNNGIGMTGVAPDAQMSGIRVSFSNDSTLSMFANAIEYGRNFDVVNNSWGFTAKFGDDFTQEYMAGIRNAIQNNVQFGRGGLGTNIVFAAGNGGASGDNVNYHNMQNSAFTIAVAAVNKNGIAASFSNPGAALLVSAPGVEIYTTDNTGNSGYVAGDYVGVGGTSFAAPIVTGIIALMLEANASLGYRDVQEILAYSARKIDVNSTGWQTNGADNWNGTGLHFSHTYGFGMADAHTAVRLAESWGQGQGTYATLDTAAFINYANVAIPDNGWVSSTISITQNLLIDRIEVMLDITHANASQLDVVLISPNGTQSLLFDQANVSEFPVFMFNTTANWGETSAGDWTIQVFDRVSGIVGTLNAWIINFLGDVVTNNDRYFITDEFAGVSSNVYTISDTDGGQDTLNASALSQSITLDLQARTGSTGGRGIAIAAGTTLETILTGDGNDSIRGATTGNTTINGGRGIDTFIFGGTFNHTVTVNSTADIVLTSNTPGGDTTHLLNVETFQVGGVNYTLNQLLALSITQTENIIRDGTSRSETLNGDAGNDVLNSLGGNDTVNGYAGNDVLRGGTGTDTLYGGAGNDTLYGDDGTDYIYGGLDNDAIYGGIGNDRLYGDAGDDIITGGAGLDMMYGGTGNDTYVLDAADGNIDRIYDFSATGAGADTLDLSQLLIDYDSGTDLIADFVRFTVSGADTAIRVNADGLGNDFVTLGRIYGATLTNTVQDYLDQGLLVVS